MDASTSEELLDSTSRVKCKAVDRTKDGPAYRDVTDDPDLADQLSDWHLWGAWALPALVMAHVGAACWHHWIRSDGVLVDMLPRAGRGRGH